METTDGVHPRPALAVHRDNNARACIRTPTNAGRTAAGHVLSPMVAFTPMIASHFGSADEGNALRSPLGCLQDVKEQSAALQVLPGEPNVREPSFDMSRRRVGPRIEVRSLGGDIRCR